MALNSYLTLTGETQGQIMGSVTRSGKEDTIEIIAVKHMVHWPLDAVTGLPGVTKKHKPITLIKEVDKSSPKLFTMLTRNENITGWELNLYRATNDGTEEQYYTIELQNARITSIRFNQMNTLDDETLLYPNLEYVTFVYETITFTYEPEGIISQDDWVQLTG